MHPLVRGIAAYFAATSVADVASVAGTPLAWHHREITSTLLWLGTFFPFAALVVFAFGLPAFMMLFSLNLVRWWSAAIAGGLIGSIVSLVIWLPNDPTMEIALNPVAMCAGALGGLTFWAVWDLGKRWWPGRPCKFN